MAFLSDLITLGNLAMRLVISYPKLSTKHRLVVEPLSPIPSLEGRDMVLAGSSQKG